MPANVTHEYRRAEAMFREAVSSDEKIQALELMLQTIPKHKGTDHMQADIKRRLAKLRDGSGGKGGAARQKDVFHVPRGTAGGQVGLLGTPNSGKSSILAHTTNAHVQVADYPFSTTAPLPGIMLHEDVPIQLVDMPPITAEHIEPGQVGAYRNCDLVMVVLDLAATDVTEEWDICLDFLRERNFIPDEMEGETGGDVFKHLYRPCLAVFTKSDLAAEGDFGVIEEMYGQVMPMLAVSVHDEGSLKKLAATLFEMLRIVRVYSKLPHQEPDMEEPFTLRIGATVHDLAYKVHRELADKLRFARIWGEGKYPGQQVPRDYALHDKDIIELHFNP